ncbi:SusF/SusE family outer membrane protein [Sphingobacterium sp. SGR-19]|uniref:SusF/SusE family outer membrane protein n=1 Tax=Sphingobacterium sp. SGR-19 TaxID=2710886 RepID=UPI0013EAE79F|nr:SusF/SusE family outer membrane protein [Sphingobacterium sp. SGR-19]NGM63805.1 SusF/SusE family outer membrane protein [Sphingobacterium sp. SGR-19]
MKTHKIYISLMTVMVLAMGWFTSCKKVVHEIDDAIVSINENTPNSVQLGQKLRVGFISNRVNAFEFSIVKDGDALMTEQITLEGDEKILSREFDIPNDGSWMGDVLLQVSYDAGGQRIEKTRALTILESSPEMFLVGGSTGAGWEPPLATPMFLYNSESKDKFEIFEYITADGGGFKFLPDKTWDNAYGLGASAGTLLQAGDAGNITVEENGFYRVRMDAEALTYDLLKVTWGIVGDATAGGWDQSTDMMFEGGKGTYTWKITANLSEGGLKFRYNNAWDFDDIPANLGGDESNLTWGGSNIDITSAGTYNIELNLSPAGYTAKIEKQ